MIKGKHHAAIVASTIAILFGGAFLVWFYELDGRVLDKPLTFTNGVDPMALKTEKAAYRPGETVRAYTAFCKNRDYVSATQWALSDRFLTVYAQQPSKELANGCYPDSGGTELFDVEQLPSSLPPGCDYFFTGQAVRDIGGGRTVTQQFRTRTFCVDAPPALAS
jgi:hypothetical protein